MYPNFQINNVERIDQQIAELERLKNSFRAMPQQPIQNIINTNGAGVEFEARYLNENEKPEEIMIQRKTAFISLKSGKLQIKEVNGDITTYDIVNQKQLNN